jgi:hypothetical protein
MPPLSSGDEEDLDKLESSIQAQVEGSEGVVRCCVERLPASQLQAIREHTPDHIHIGGDMEELEEDDEATADEEFEDDDDDDEVPASDHRLALSSHGPSLPP